MELLIDELWGESPPATVNKSVQVYVSRLRKQLGDGRLVTRAPGYVLRVDPSESDLGRFERLVAEAGGADPATAAETLREALALWRGPPLADLAYEPFLQGEIARLTELRLSALERRIDADLARGRHAELVGELERAILAQDRALDLVDEGSAAETSVSDFVGRDRELAALDGALEDALAGRGRLVLLAGEPGIGKSRMAAELTGRARTRNAGARRALLGGGWRAPVLALGSGPARTCARGRA